MQRRYSDQAIVDTDRLQEELEKALKELYEEAQKGLEESHNEFLRRFGRSYAEAQAMVANGEMTKQEFQRWIQSQIGQDDRWQSMVDEMADKILHANAEACNMINDATPNIYAQNYNYSLYTISQYSGSIAWNLVDESTVRELVLGANHTDFKVSDGNGGFTFRRYLTPEQNAKVDYNWNSQQIQRRLTAGILQGKSALGIANDFYGVMGNNYKAAVRNARTAITSAQNSGRMASYEQAAAMGIKVEKEWIATLDERTRESHQDIDGETVPYKDRFSNGLMYPADTAGDPAEVYNCRCTMRAVFPKTPNRVHRITYNEWKNNKNIVVINQIGTEKVAFLLPYRNQELNKKIKKVADLISFKYNEIEVYPKEKIDASNFFFDDEHINVEKERKITKEEALEYIKSAVIMVKRWNGESVLYYSYEGATYLNVKKKSIATSFRSEHFDEKAKELLKVVKEYESSNLSVN